MLLIGIDSGKKTGLAIYDAEHDEFTELVSTDFWGVLNNLKRVHELTVPQSTVLIEDSRLKSFNWHIDRRTTKAMAAKIGRNVGTVDARCELMEQALKELGFNVVCVPAINTKKSKQYFIDRGYAPGSNEHIRDAQMAVLNNLEDYKLSLH